MYIQSTKDDDDDNNEMVVMLSIKRIVFMIMKTRILWTIYIELDLSYSYIYKHTFDDD